MNALDVLSLQDAKDYLKVDFDEDNNIITSLIKAAVSMVEKSTEYRLYQRTELIKTSKIEYTAFQFPFNGATVEAMDSQGTYNIRLSYQTLRTELFWGNGYWYYGNDHNFFNPSTYNVHGCQTNFNLTLDVGYTDVTLVPDELITAVKQVITDKYENRNITNEQLLNNISIFIAPYKRFATIL
jgi:hypothetical protein